MVMIADIYTHGAANYPSCRVENDHLSSSFVTHPGQHLLWIRNFLGLDNTVWFSIRKDFNKIRPKIFNDRNKIIEITSSEQIVDILGTDNINAWIQNWTSGVSSPAIFPSIPRTGWDSFNDDNGHCIMPWDKASEFRYNDDKELMPWGEWMDAVLSSINPIEMINEKVEIKKEFPNLRLTLNNFLAFMLTGNKEDSNFKFKDI